jgi:O-methyltransferase
VDVTEPQAGELYLDLLKRALTGALHEENDLILGGRRGEGTWKYRIANRVADFAGSFHVEMARKRPYDAALRERGLDRPGRAESMIGLRRMDNLRFCIESVLRDDIPGDLIEAGVWRGGRPSSCAQR